MKKKNFLALAVLFFSHFSWAQVDWTLKVNEDGVKVFTKTNAETGLKAIRVQCSITATLSQMVALVLDVNAGTDWVYGTKSSVLLRKVSPSELYYYSEVDLPWPLSNRDFIAHLSVIQDPRSKIVTIHGPTVPEYVPEKKDIIRVRKSSGKWVIAPIGSNNINIDYTLEVDPSGSIPIWLVNLFATNGPLETFKRLKVQLKKSAYTNVSLPFIVN